MVMCVAKVVGKLSSARGSGFRRWASRGEVWGVVFRVLIEGFWGIKRREAGSSVLLEQRWVIPANSVEGENQQM